MLRILFVCLGNICRSPMAEGLFRKHVADMQLSDHIFCDSGGTASYHLGELADKRMRQTADSHGITLTHKARQFKRNDFEDFHYVLVMDQQNYNDVMRLKPINATAEVIFLRSFDDMVQDEKEVPDPYYGNPEDFETVYYILEGCTRNFLQHLVKKHSLPAAQHS